MAGRLVTGTLAARGARSPDALAAFIASRARAGQQVIGLAGEEEFGGQGTSTCPRCGYTGSSSSFSGGETLRTPAPSTGYVRNGAQLTVRGPGSNAGPGLANDGGGLELAAPRYPVTGPADLLVSNRPEGGAVIRHRRGGTEIGHIINDGAWKAVYGGKPQKGHPHQSGALGELLGLWNAGITTLQHPGSPASAPQQTPLMQQYGVPAINALATPSVGQSDGPRMTSSAASGSDNDEDDSSGSSGLTPKGQAIFRKLKARGWPDAKAMTFAKRAQSFGGSKS